MVFKVEVDGAKELEKELSLMPATLFESVKTIYAAAVLGAQKKVLDNLRGDPLQTRSGLLARSIKPEVLGSDVKSLKASIYSAGQVKGQPVVYAPIQEFGGTIKAKSAYSGVPGGPYLNIPLPDNKTPLAGVMREGAREVFKAGGFIYKSRKGNYIVAKGKGGRLFNMFVLKKSVIIPPRLGMQDAANGELAIMLQSMREMRLL